MNVLNILPYLPNLNSGSRVRDYNIIKYLSKLGVNSQTICNDDTDNEIIDGTLLEKELNTRIHLSKVPDVHILAKMNLVLLNRMYPPIYRYDTSTHIGMISSVIKNNKFDIIDSRHMVEAAPLIAACSETSFKGLKIFSLHNVDHLNFSRSIDLYKNPLIRFSRKRVATKFKEHELDMISKFDHLIVVSNTDKEIYLSEGIPEDKIDVIPNGVDCNYFNQSEFNNNIALNHPNILFMGILSYKPNEIAISKYLQHIHPIVKKQMPSITFYIIGKNCPEWLNERSKNDDSIKIIGFVEDVRPYIYNANVCIAPLTAGSGTRLKILEYMSMGKPVVSTTIGAEGIDVDDTTNILLADNWNKFTHKIIELLNNEHFAEQIGANGRKLVEKKYDWKSIVEKQKKVYEKLLEK